LHLPLFRIAILRAAPPESRPAEQPANLIA
jgi:hypothetical protein